MRYTLNKRTAERPAITELVAGTTLLLFIGFAVGFLCAATLIYQYYDHKPIVELHNRP